MAELLATVTPPGPTRRVLSSARTRIVIWFLLLLVAATVASVLAAREVLLLRAEERTDEALTLEVEELRNLATTGIDPATSEPFGEDVGALLRVFLRRNLPASDQAFLAWVDGEPVLAGSNDDRVDREDPVIAALGRSTAPRRGTLQLEGAGEVEYLALPLLVGESEVAGVFAVFALRSAQFAQVAEVARVLAGVGGVVVLLASTILWTVAGRILTPVRQLTDTARAITDTDLTRRIEVSGDDEVSQLARTFNAMLDRLETAFDAQRDFVSDAGHELRTPITIVRGHLELMGEDPVERAEAMPIVFDELDRMSRFVDDLLLLAKSKRPDFLNLATVAVGPLTDELVAKARGMAARTWEVEATAKGSVVADRQRLSQAVLQLVANAVQHTGEGDTIALGSTFDDGEVRMWVRDDGPGVPYEDQKRIFERFARANGPRPSEGAGLGLSIVCAIAEAHHGRVELRSRPGAGAVFTLVLPVDQPGGA